MMNAMKRYILIIILISLVTLCCKKENAISISITVPSTSLIRTTNITKNTCIVFADIESDGGAAITERGVCYKTTTNPTIADNKIVSTGTIGGYSVTLTGLIPNTTYYYRSYATNAKGVAYSNQMSFTTIKDSVVNIISLPAITTNPLTNVSGTSFTANATIVSNGGAPIIQKGFCYKTYHNPDTTNTSIADTMQSTTFSNNITGLIAGNTYYVRAYAINSKGISYGNEVYVTFGLNVNYLPKLIVAVSGANTTNFNFTYDSLGRLTQYNTTSFYYSGNSSWPTNSSTTTYEYDSSGNLSSSYDNGNPYSNIYAFTVEPGFIGKYFNLQGAVWTWNGDSLYIDSYNNATRLCIYNGYYATSGGQTSRTDDAYANVYTYTNYMNPLYNVKSIYFILDGIAAWLYSYNLPLTETKYRNSNNAGYVYINGGSYTYTFDNLGRVATSTETFNNGTIQVLTYTY